MFVNVQNLRLSKIFKLEIQQQNSNNTHRIKFRMKTRILKLMKTQESIGKLSSQEEVEESKKEG